MKEQIIDQILNKLTDNGNIKYADIGEHEDFKKRYIWYKDYLKEKLPDFTEEDIIKFHKNFHKFKDIVYAFNGFGVALTLMEEESRAKKN